MLSTGMEPVRSSIYKRNFCLNPSEDSEDTDTVVFGMAEEVEVVKSFPFFSKLYLARMWLLPSYGNGGNQKTLKATLLQLGYG